jgi:hypothetical protein
LLLWAYHKIIVFYPIVFILFFLLLPPIHNNCRGFLSVWGKLN